MILCFEIVTFFGEEGCLRYSNYLLYIMVLTMRLEICNFSHCVFINVCVFYG